MQGVEIMNKCRTCGTEFDGNFCPNCGRKWQETLVCANCGAKIAPDVNFCPTCGTPVSLQSPAPTASPTMNAAQPSEGMALKTVLQKAARFMPDLLLLLFSLAAFLFYCAPVAVMPGGELLGEKIPSESYGNLYQLIKPLDGNIFVPFLILPIVTAVSALFAAICLILSKKHYVFVVIRYLFWLFFIIFASVVIAKVNQTDEGMGLIKAGSCFILILVFSIVFAFISIILDPFRRKTSQQVSVSLTIVNADFSGKIAARAYADRTDLYSVKINKGIKRIGREAFRDCLKLNYVSVGSDVVMIEDNVFLGCVSLIQINFPASLKEIGWYALCNCINLEKIVFDGTQEQWEKVHKGNMWDEESGQYIVVCKDGVLQKQRPEQ